MGFLEFLSALLGFGEQAININEGRLGEERANEISRGAVERFQPNLDALQSSIFGSGGSLEGIGGLLNDPGLTPNFTPPPDLSGMFSGQLGEFLPGGSSALTPASDIFDASRSRISGLSDTGFLDPLRSTPGFDALRGQLPNVSTDLSAERTAELSNLAQSQRNATGQALQDVLGFRGRFSPEELSQVQQDRSRELAQPFQIAAPQVRAQFAGAERGLEQQQRSQDQQLLQFAEGLRAQQQGQAAGIEAGLRGQQISTEAGFAPQELAGGLQQAGFQTGILGQQVGLAQQDFQNVFGQEQQGVQNLMSQLMAQLQKFGIDINTFLNLTNTATGALTGQNIFVPQVDLTSGLQAMLNRQAAEPPDQKSSFGLSVYGTGGSLGCLHGETLLRTKTEDGLSCKALKMVQVDDLVECADGEYRKVLGKRFGGVPKEERDGRMIEVDCGCCQIVCTIDHPIGDGAAGDLRVGDTLDTVFGPKEIERISPHDWAVEGDLIIEGDAEYYAGGILVKSSLGSVAMAQQGV